MNENSTYTFNLENHYLWLDDEGRTHAVDDLTDFWEKLGKGEIPTHRRLMTAFELTNDFPHWEMHPCGDEIFTLVSGQITCLLEFSDGRQEQHDLNAGQSFVIPKGVWHRVIVRKPGKLVVVTAGENTQHRPVE